MFQQAEVVCTCRYTLGRSLGHLVSGVGVGVTPNNHCCCLTDAAAVV